LVEGVMATYEDLCEQFRQMNKKAQRIQHQNEMLRRRLPIARTSLEALFPVAARLKGAISQL